MKIFDTSIMQWRERTEGDKEYAQAVIEAAFPELVFEVSNE